MLAQASTPTVEEADGIHPIPAVEEVLIAGTSPAMLVEGLSHARSGKKVTFVDSAPSMGGAWSSTEAFGIRDIEAACHLIVNYEGVYEWMEAECGVALEACHPQPRILHNGSLQPFASRSQVLSRCASIAVRMAVVASVRLVEIISLKRWQFKPTADYDFGHAWENLAKRRLCPIFGSEEKRAAKYPVGGSPEMIRRFSEELKASGARFLQDKITCLEISSNAPLRISLESGDSIRTRELVLPESLSLAQLIVNNKNREFQVRTNTHVALILKVKGLSANTLGYVELPFDPLVERVADVTDFCTPSLPDGTRILICENPGIGAKGNSNPDPEKTVQYLKDLNILPESLSVEDSKVHHLTLHKSDSDLLQSLKDLKHPSLSLLPTRGDLAYSFHRNKNRWASLSHPTQNR